MRHTKIVATVGPACNTVEKLVEQAHVVCPYSHATKGNIPVTLTVA